MCTVVGGVSEGGEGRVKECEGGWGRGKRKYERGVWGV